MQFSTIALANVTVCFATEGTQASVNPEDVLHTVGLSILSIFAFEVDSAYRIDQAHRWYFVPPTLICTYVLLTKHIVGILYRLL